MLENEIVELAKQNLKIKGYGTFDWAEKLIPQKELLIEKPRVIRQRIASLLKVNIEIIPYKTLCSWLDRYKKNHKKKGEIQIDIESQNDNLIEVPWQKFVPTDPSAIKRKEESILKIISD